MAMAVSRPPKDCLKFKNPNAPAVKRGGGKRTGAGEDGNKKAPPKEDGDLRCYV